VLVLQNRFVIKALTVLAVGAFFYLVFFRPPLTPQIHLLEGTTMGTTWQVQVVAQEQQTALEAGAAIKGLLAHLDRAVFSTWTDGSELSRLNHSPPHVAHPVSPELLHALLLAQEIYGKSRNTFDVSLGPLVNLWGFGPEPATGMPDAAAIAAARAQLGLGKLVVDEAAATVTFTEPLTLDLSSIAEGYAADAVAALLRERGLGAFLVDVGGELRLQGTHADGEAWTLAIERPEGGARAAYAGIDSRGEALAVSTSGDYRNVRDVDGKRFSHILDPRSGKPVTHTLASVTVIGETAAEADAWSTALMVLGPEEGRAVADSEGLAAYFIMRVPTGFEHAYTAAFAPYLQHSLQHSEPLSH
jgi:thiamine biosynthesis lipoprotein